MTDPPAPVSRDTRDALIPLIMAVAQVFGEGVRVKLGELPKHLSVIDDRYLDDVHHVMSEEGLWDHPYVLAVLNDRLREDAEAAVAGSPAYAHAMYSAPVAEANEDTEPARCHAELPYGVCGEPADAGIHGNESPQNFDGYSHRFEAAPYAPASDDEKPPGPSVAQEAWEALCDAFAAPRLETDDYSFSGQFLEARLAYEAAIRAPLEARNETQKRTIQSYRVGAVAAEEQLAAVTAERDEARRKADEWHAAYTAMRELALERDKMRAALVQAKAALSENITTWITLEPTLSTPYEDDPRWTPWTRFGERAFKAAGRAHEGVNEALRPPSTESQSGSEEAN